MGWTNSHPHQFIIEAEYYGEPEEEDGYSEDLKNEKRHRLNQLVQRKGFKFTCGYDFGDNWEHTIHVETILPIEQGRQARLSARRYRRRGGVRRYSGDLAKPGAPRT